jgi:two-component system chemotaxis response regulator CheY
MPQTILVAEDDAELRETVAWCLRAEGYRVITAGDGREALRQMRTGIPNLAIIDVRMPWADGLEVVGTMRRDPQLQRIPVVVLTGFPSDVPPDLVVLPKPFSGTRLIDTVQAIFGGLGARRPRYRTATYPPVTAGAAPEHDRDDHADDDKSS